MNLEDLGYGDWHRSRLESREQESRLARVTAVDREAYVIGSPAGWMPAEVTGKLLYCSDSLEDLPCVGDWVLVDYLDNREHAVIHGVLPRRTILRRRAPGGEAAYQPIAANIDVAYIVQSCDVDFSLNRLDRYLVMAADGGISARLLLTKSDLVEAPVVQRLVADVRKEHGIEVTPISSSSGAGYGPLQEALGKGVTYCLLGSSGVGKSTILNRLLGEESLAVGPVRQKSGKGQHTTTRRQLIVLPAGALFIDTPGMRELGMMGFGTGLQESYEDISAAAAGCRYADCTHTVEKGCAVLARVDAGELSEERYRGYLKLLKESRHYESTYVQRRKSDRAFGKMLKNYQKRAGGKGRSGGDQG